ncbi:ATP-binding protein [Furfurilactobacillus curtus]|uniref:AAA+ ATPase domain-containing protein n=1 Tax=Furfurilactobacillus curtus TaxID=1746200 RepID=A0ABQ5JUT0_9LACO
MTKVLTDVAVTRSQARPVRLTADQWFNQHLLIVGQTGSGKSTTTVTLINALMENDQTAIVIDPTGEYAHLPHAVVGKLGTNAFLDYRMLTASQLASLAGIKDPAVIVLIDQAITSLRVANNVLHQKTPYQKLGRPWSIYERQVAQLHDFPRPYHIELLPTQLLEECVIPAVGKQADFALIGQQYDGKRQRELGPALIAIRRLLATRAFQQVFRLPMNAEEMRQRSAHTQLDVVYLMRLFASVKASDRCLVVDVSALSQDLAAGALVVSILAAQLLAIKQHPSAQQPVVLVVDEAHRYLTAAATKIGAFSEDGLSRIAREGRKVGLYLLLTTQSPLDLPVQLLGEFGNLIVHRLTTTSELQTLAMVPSLLISTIAHQEIGEATLVGHAFAEPVPVYFKKTVIRHETASPRFD